MKAIFTKRRFHFLNQCSRYLRYVFNDHFVLVLIFLLGFLMVQYSQLLKHFPANHWPIILVLALVVLALLFWGNIATYLEPADQQFLLVREKDIVVLIQKAKRRTLFFWGIWQTLLLLILAPLFLRLGLTLFSFLFLLLFLLFLKGLIIEKKSKTILKQKGLNWDQALNQEKKRQQAILKFFSLFTNVKGISISVKRRAYLDFWTKLLPKNSHKTWTNLYLRAFLRSGDYLGLALRLGLLGLLSLLFIANPLMSAGLALLFNYLLLFQLLALYKHYDYQYLTALFPISKAKKKTNLKQLLRVILYFLTAVEFCFSFSWQKTIILLLAMLCLNEVYLPYKIKKMID
ncbi:ABC transporter permease [Streptococcus troglodytae]